jgi:hypothetical protein
MILHENPDNILLVIGGDIWFENVEVVAPD